MDRPTDNPDQPPPPSASAPRTEAAGHAPEVSVATATPGASRPRTPRCSRRALPVPRARVPRVPAAFRPRRTPQGPPGPAIPPGAAVVRAVPPRPWYGALPRGGRSGSVVTSDVPASRRFRTQAPLPGPRRPGTAGSSRATRTRARAVSVGCRPRLSHCAREGPAVHRRGPLRAAARTPPRPEASRAPGRTRRPARPAFDLALGVRPPGTSPGARALAYSGRTGRKRAVRGPPSRSKGRTCPWVTRPQPRQAPAA